VASWADVEDLCRALPDASSGQASDGSPAWYAGRHQFARLRWDDDGGELVQVWSGDLDVEAELAERRTTFTVVHTFRFRVWVWAVLAELDRRELAELLLDSYAIRGGVRRAAAVDQAAYFALA
jgi:hypothetical protein